MIDLNAGETLNSTMVVIFVLRRQRTVIYSEWRGDGGKHVFRQTKIVYNIIAIYG